MTPKLSGKKALHSVPVIKISVSKPGKKKEAEVDIQLLGVHVPDQSCLSQINNDHSLISEAYVVENDTKSHHRLAEEVISNRATSPSYRKQLDESLADLLSVMPDKSGKKFSQNCLGAQSERECRKIINNFNLLNINRH